MSITLKTFFWLAQISLLTFTFLNFFVPQQAFAILFESGDSVSCTNPAGCPTHVTGGCNPTDTSCGGTTPYSSVPEPKNLDWSCNVDGTQMTVTWDEVGEVGGVFTDWNGVSGQNCGVGYTTSPLCASPDNITHPIRWDYQGPGDAGWGGYATVYQHDGYDDSPSPENRKTFTVVPNENYDVWVHTRVYGSAAGNTYHGWSPLVGFTNIKCVPQDPLTGPSTPVPTVEIEARVIGTALWYGSSGTNVIYSYPGPAEVEMQYRSNNATSCTSNQSDFSTSGNTGGAWRLDTLINEPAIGSTKTYTVTCTNGSQSVSDSITLSPYSAATPACSDGVDNDGDGLVDYPNDPGCTSPTDPDEYNAPPATGSGFNIIADTPTGPSSLSGSNSGTFTSVQRIIGDLVSSASAHHAEFEYDFNRDGSIDRINEVPVPSGLSVSNPIAISDTTGSFPAGNHRVRVRPDSRNLITGETDNTDVSGWFNFTVSAASALVSNSLRASVNGGTWSSSDRVGASALNIGDTLRLRDVPNPLTITRNGINYNAACDYTTDTNGASVATPLGGTTRTYTSTCRWYLPASEGGTVTATDSITIEVIGNGSTPNIATLEGRDDGGTWRTGIYAFPSVEAGSTFELRLETQNVTSCTATQLYGNGNSPTWPMIHNGETPSSMIYDVSHLLPTVGRPYDQEWYSANNSTRVDFRIQCDSVNGPIPVRNVRVYVVEPAPQCDDGIDNDGDGFTDYPNDPDCDSPTDNTEGDPTPPPTPPSGGVDDPAGTITVDTSSAGSRSNSSDGVTVQFNIDNSDNVTEVAWVCTSGTEDGTLGFDNTVSPDTTIALIPPDSSQTFSLQCRDGSVVETYSIQVNKSDLSAPVGGTCTPNLSITDRVVNAGETATIQLGDTSACVDANACVLTLNGQTQSGIDFTTFTAVNSNYETIPLYSDTTVELDCGAAGSQTGVIRVRSTLEEV